MTTPTFMVTFIVRLPVAKGTTRLEAEALLREQILESGEWQANPKVYVRESKHMTPELEKRHALMLQERFEEQFCEKTPEQIALKQLKTAKKAEKKIKKEVTAEDKAIIAERKAAVQARLLAEWEKDLVITAARQLEIDQMPKYRGNKNARV